MISSTEKGVRGGGGNQSRNFYYTEKNINWRAHIVVGAEVEPSFLALGPFHLALGMNNRYYI